MRRHTMMLKEFAVPALITLLAIPAHAGNWPAASPPVIAGSNGYVDIPNAALPRDPSHDYKAVFDAKKENPDRSKRSPQILRLALQINGLVQAGVPDDHVHFAIVLHGPAADAVLTSGAYRKKYGIENPNIGIIGALVKRGVRFYVCGQYIANQDISAEDILPEIKVAEAATLALIRLQNDGFALVPDG